MNQQRNRVSTVQVCVHVREDKEEDKGQKTGGRRKVCVAVCDSPLKINTR